MAAGFMKSRELSLTLMKLNGGGNNHKNKPVVTGVIETEKINQAGKFFVILGRQTFSACQNLVNELDNYTNVTFVGEPSGENINFYGDVNAVHLPNSGIPVRLSFAWWQDKNPWDERPWMPPHIYVEMSSEDYFTNHDPVLEAIWTAKPGARFDPIAHIMELFEQSLIVLKHSSEQVKYLTQW